MTRPTLDHNRLTAYIAGGIVLLLAVTAAGIVVVIPGSTLATIDKIPIKVAILAGVAVFLIHLGYSIFVAFYQPPAWRMYLKVIRLTIFLGVFVTAAPASLFALERLQLNAQLSSEEPTVDLTVTWGSAVSGSIFGFVATVLLLIGLVWLYSKECEAENARAAV